MIKSYITKTKKLLLKTGILSAMLLVSSNASAAAFSVAWGNPTSFTTVEALVLGILNALVVIATPIVVLMIIYGGFLYVTARGNAEQIRKATTSLTYAIIGGILVIGAVALTGIIQVTVNDFRAP